ncbi:hypothetical protein GCM10020370_10010 [Paenibacillus hodogayensis]
MTDCRKQPNHPADGTSGMVGLCLYLLQGKLPEQLSFYVYLLGSGGLPFGDLRLVLL